MNKNKLIKSISTTMIIFTLMSSFSFAVPKSDLISNYLYNDADRILSNINLLSKTIFTINDNLLPDKKVEFLNDINRYISELSYLTDQMQQQYSDYNDDNYTLNGLYALSLIFSELRFALVQLKEYLITTSTEEEYEYLQSFFVLKTEAARKINSAKLAMPNTK